MYPVIERREVFAAVAVAASAACAGPLVGGGFYGGTVGAIAATACILRAVLAPRSELFVPTLSFGTPGAAARGEVALTFDDGPDARVTPAILDLLAAHHAKASFFVVGERALATPAVVARIRAEGHTLGSHTFAHSPFFHAWRAHRQEIEIIRGMDAVAHCSGERPTYFRPPQGIRTPPLRSALAKVGVRCVTWSIRGGDAMGASARQIVRRVVPALAPGAIVALHDGAGYGGSKDRQPTLEALGVILREVAKKGLRAVTLDTLLST